MTAYNDAIKNLKTFFDENPSMLLWILKQYLFYKITFQKERRFFKMRKVMVVSNDLYGTKTTYRTSKDIERFRHWAFKEALAFYGWQNIKALNWQNLELSTDEKEPENSELWKQRAQKIDKEREALLIREQALNLDRERLIKMKENELLTLEFNKILGAGPDTSKNWN